MSIFKKPEKGFLAKLFKHQQVEELAEELAHTYANEMQEDLQSESDEPTASEDTAAEPVPMLEVTETGEVDFTEPSETTEGESPPQDTEPSEVRKAKKKYGENCCYELDQYHECRKKLKELFPDGIIPKIKDLQDELKKAREDYAKMSAERKALKKEADRLSRLAQQKRDSQRTLARYMQNEQAGGERKVSLNKERKIL